MSTHQSQLNYSLNQAETEEVAQLIKVKAVSISLKKLRYLIRAYSGSHLKLAQKLNTKYQSVYAWDCELYVPTPKYTANIDKLFQEVFTPLKLGQVNKTRKHTAWNVTRRHWERVIGMPRRPPARRPVSEKGQGKGNRCGGVSSSAPPHETDSTRHPIFAAVARAVREGYEIPVEVAKTFNVVVGVPIHEAFYSNGMPIE